MKNLCTTLMLSLMPLLMIAQLSINAGYQPTIENQEKLLAEVELSFRLDVDRKQTMRYSDIALLAGARYGIETRKEEGVKQLDYIYLFVKGYFPLELGRLRGVASIEYDLLNDRFATGPGLMYPFSNNLSLHVETIFGLYGSANNELAIDPGGRIVLKFRLGR